ncbi:hypothetical protein HUO13_11960 [Saccharopolyspora erythraea]|uniref:hypothetical protein n=1 Tax=Saccharopolyspora erythraea TaxID=1836 RepID=UPI001BAD1BA3|nr:hypothetical protein [Saccharopolyspora erythraea]QUH01430.1 hypothetical protein HUO13_11960 [Saccharopolyspora erythraea]
MSVFIRATECMVEMEFETPSGKRIATLHPREAYALATYAEWLVFSGQTGDEPSCFLNLPDEVALTPGDVESCPDGHEHAVSLFLAVDLGTDRTNVHAIEIKREDDLALLPVALFAAAATATR